MTLRDHLTPDKQWAHRILDLVKAGLPVRQKDIYIALATLGDVE